MRGLSALPAEERRAAGASLNEIKVRIEAAVAARAVELGSRPAGPAIDPTGPGRSPVRGYPHPLAVTMDEVAVILATMGFETATGPLIVDEAVNFDFLNTPADHPARDMQDTYYLPGGRLLRTHTSAMWAEALRRRDPPLRIACPGRCYRRDAADATHSPDFHQVEGLWVDDRCRFSDLKGVLAEFFSAFFRKELRMRFEPRFFPFTEPSTEMSVECPSCAGAGCPACARSGWLEVGGAGMVHPNILRTAGRGFAAPMIRGFAFGIGIERLAMLKHRIADMRWLYDNDLRVFAQARG